MRFQRWRQVRDALFHLYVNLASEIPEILPRGCSRLLSLVQCCALLLGWVGWDGTERLQHGTALGRACACLGGGLQPTEEQ